MSTYRAPWSKAIKITTRLVDALMIGIGLAQLLPGIHQVSIGDPIGWLLASSSIVCWAIPILVCLWAPQGYRIGDTAVYVCKNVGDEEFPFSKIASIEIRDGRDVFASALRVMGSGGYYGIFGTFTGGALGSFRALATNDGLLVVLRMKRGEPVVISPERPRDFARELSDKAGLPLEEKVITPEPISMRRVPLSKWEKALEALALMLLVATWAAVPYFWGNLPGTIPSHFNALGKPDEWGPKSTFLIAPETALGMYALFTAITVVVSRMSKVPLDQPKAARMVTFIRSLLSVTKCFVIGLVAYTTWNSGFVALGQAQGLGIGFTVVALLLAVLAAPAILIAAAINSK